MFILLNSSGGDGVPFPPPSTPTPTPIPVPVATVALAFTAMPPVTAAPAAPLASLIYSGTFTVEGESAPDGLKIVGRILDYETSPVLTQGGRYFRLVVAPPDSLKGQTLAFHILGFELKAREFILGFQGGPGSRTLNLTFAALPAPPTPTATLTSIPTPTPVVSTMSLQITMFFVNGGRVVTSPPMGPDGTYPEGQEVTVTARPNIGYEFVRWSGVTASTENPTTVVMSDNTSLVAFFTTTLPTPTPTATPTRVPTPIAATQFTFGSHKDDVIRIQGTPISANIYEFFGEEVWGYGPFGLATVTFDLATQRVITWDDFEGVLKVSV